MFFFTQFLCISLIEHFVALFLTYGGISHLFILNSCTQFWLVAIFLRWVLLSIGPSSCLLLNFSFGGHTIIFIINEHMGAKTTSTSTSPMLFTMAKEVTRFDQAMLLWRPSARCRNMFIEHPLHGVQQRVFKLM